MRIRRCVTRNVFRSMKIRTKGAHKNVTSTRHLLQRLPRGRRVDDGKASASRSLGGLKHMCSSSTSTAACCRPPRKLFLCRADARQLVPRSTNDQQSSCTATSRPQTARAKPCGADVWVVSTRNIPTVSKPPCHGWGGREGGREGG